MNSKSLSVCIVSVWKFKDLPIEIGISDSSIFQISIWSFLESIGNILNESDSSGKKFTLMLAKFLPEGEDYFASSLLPSIHMKTRNRIMTGQK
tara:strand:- start:230 stop:508 length:279 start_codon:yes stop_codon:yes gene_type:complete